MSKVIRPGDGTPGPHRVCACGNRLRARSEQVSGRCWGCGIAERRNDDGFMSRLRQRIREDRAVLEALAESDSNPAVAGVDLLFAIEEGP